MSFEKKQQDAKRILSSKKILPKNLEEYFSAYSEGIDAVKKYYKKEILHYLSYERYIYNPAQETKHYTIINKEKSNKILARGNSIVGIDLLLEEITQLPGFDSLSQDLTEFKNKDRNAFKGKGKKFTTQEEMDYIVEILEKFKTTLE